MLQINLYAEQIGDQIFIHESQKKIQHRKVLLTFWMMTL